MKGEEGFAYRKFDRPNDVDYRQTVDNSGGRRIFVARSNHRFPIYSFLQTNYVMGLMQKLRENMPAVIIFLIVMFVALIVFEWGDARKGGGRVHTGGAAIGNVEGHEISSLVYQKRIEEEKDRQKQASQDKKPPEDEQVREQIWQQMVNEAIVQETADQLGVYVSDDEITETMLYDPPQGLKQSFIDSSGVYLEAEYLKFITNVRGYLSNNPQFDPAKFPGKIDKVEAEIMSIETAMRAERLRQLVESVITASSIPSPVEALAAYKDQNSKASGRFVLIDAQAIPDSTITVSDEEAKKFFEEHKNEFVQKATREMKYVQYPLQPSGQDSNYVARRLKQATEDLGRATTPEAKDSAFTKLATQFGYGEYDGANPIPLQDIPAELQTALAGAVPHTVIGPIQLPTGSTMILVKDIVDSGEVYVRAQHILLRTDPGTNEDSVKAQTDKVLKRIRAGEAFESLAQQFSADGSAQKGGDLGYFTRAKMVKEFSDAAFNNPVGALVGPVKTKYGYHIIKINDRSQKSYVLADMKFDVKVSGPTRNTLRNRARTFRDKLLAKGNIDTVAAADKLQVLDPGPLDRSVAAAGSIRLTNWAFNGKQGDVSEQVELPDGTIIVAVLSKVRPAGPMTFEEAKDQVIAKIRQKRRLDMIKPQAEKFRSAFSPGDSITKATQIDSTLQPRSFTDVTRTAPFPGVGYEPALSNAVFSLKLGELSPLIRGERGYYVVVVDRSTLPSDADYQKEREKFVQGLITQSRGKMFSEWLQARHEQITIVDNRRG